MKYKNLTLFLTLSFLALVSMAQKGKNDNRPLPSYQKVNGDFKNVKGNFNSPELITEFLRENIGFLREQHNKLKLIHYIESPKANHYTFQQFHKDILVYGGQFKVNTDKKGNILSRFDGMLYLPSDQPHQLSIQDSKEQHLNTYQPGLSDKAVTRIEKVWFGSNDLLIPAVRLILLPGPHNYYEVILNENGEPLFRNKLAPNYAAQDTLVNGKVFMPDPLTTAGETYGGNYSDDNDQDKPELNNERVNVSFTANYTGSGFTLENSYAKITEFSAPATGTTTSSNPDFFYKRSESSFEDVNAFYHITNMQNHVQGLGFTNLANYQIEIDAHGFNGADNSNFNPGYSPPRLTFGEGGVDDAEDADVLIHEYAHALSYSGAPGTNNGNERKTIEEGLGDYFAASYSKHYDNYRWQYVFSWDGQNEFWSGRMASSEKCYKNNLDFSNIYKHADIWSSTLMEIWFYLGRDTTDQIMLQSLYSYSSNMDMVDAANLFIQADSLLYGGSHYNTIYTLFSDRGILGPCHTGITNPELGDDKIKLLNSVGFSVGEQAFVKFHERQSGMIELTNMNGQRLFQKPFKKSLQIAIPKSDLKPGMYFLRIYSGNNPIETFKLIRIE